MSKGARQTEYRSVGRKGMEIRAVSETESTFRFTGYGSVFNHEYEVWDWDGEFDEVVEPGAFTRTLNHSGGRIPVLGDHFAHVGYTRDGGEDAKGLWFDHELMLDVPEARAKRALVKQAHELGRPYGESIGFKVITDIWSTVAERRKRQLKEIRLYEVSLTPFPANDAAGVTDVRAALRALQARGIISADSHMCALSDSDPAPAQATIDPEALHSIADKLGRLEALLR